MSYGSYGAASGYDTSAYGTGGASRNYYQTGYGNQSAAAASYRNRINYYFFSEKTLERYKNLEILEIWKNWWKSEKSSALVPSSSSSALSSACSASTAGFFGTGYAGLGYSDMNFTGEIIFITHFCNSFGVKRKIFEGASRCYMGESWARIVAGYAGIAILVIFFSFFLPPHNPIIKVKTKIFTTN